MHILKGKKIAWVNISHPSKEDIEYLRKTYHIHPVILEELRGPSFRSRVEHYGNYLFLIFHATHYDHTVETSVKREIDFVITKNTVITVHYDRVEPFEELIKTFEKDTVRKERALGESSGLLVYYLLNSIHNFSMRQLNHLEEIIEKLNRDIFSSDEHAMLRRISHVKREILDYQIINGPQKIILESLKEAGLKFWGEDLRIYLSDLVGDHQKIIQRLETYRQIIEGLEDTNSQLLGTRMNTIMQRFTILAFLTFPLLLYTSLFQISLFRIPNEEQFLTGRSIFIAGFLIVTVVVLVALFVFRRKRWF